MLTRGRQAGPLMGALLAIAVVATVTAATPAPAPPPRAAETGGPASPAELPRVYLDTHFVPASGHSIPVNEGDDLQAAIDEARPGDELVLQAGATFVGNFILPAKAGNDTVIIRTSDLGGLPDEGVRVAPPDARSMARILSPNTFGAIDTADGAHDYRLVGIEFGVVAKVVENTGVVRLSNGDEISRDQLSSRIVVDRCYVHGNRTQNDRRGVVLNGRSQAVVDSYVSNFHEVGIDSQAIAGWAGPGPFKVANSYLAGAAENLLFGGADPLIEGVIPSDIEIRHNTFAKPLSWRKGDPHYGGIHWSVKNLFELKAARRVLIDGNVFRRSWGDAQTGYAINLKTAGSAAAPWVVTSDVTFSNNYVDGAASAISVEGRDPETVMLTRRVAIVNNLFVDIDGKRWKGAGWFLLVVAGSRSPDGLLSGPADLFVDHNTAFQSSSVISADGARSLRFTYARHHHAAQPVRRQGRRGVDGDRHARAVLPGLPVREEHPGGRSSGPLSARQLLPEEDGRRRVRRPAGRQLPACTRQSVPTRGPRRNRHRRGHRRDRGGDRPAPVAPMRGEKGQLVGCGTMLAGCAWECWGCPRRSAQTYRSTSARPSSVRW